MTTPTNLPPEIIIHIAAFAGLSVCIALRHLPALQRMLVWHTRHSNRSERVERAACRALLQAKWNAGVQAFVDADLTVAGITMDRCEDGDWSGVILPPESVRSLALRKSEHVNIVLELVANSIVAGQQDDELLQWCIERWSGFTRSLGYHLLRLGVDFDQVRAVCRMAKPDIDEKRLAEYFLDAVAENGPLDLLRRLDALCPEVAQQSTRLLESAIIGNQQEMARYLYDRLQVTDLSRAVYTAAIYNRIDIATWLYNARPQPQSVQTLPELARHGQLDLIKQIWSNGHAWKAFWSWTLASTITGAVCGNSSEVLEWLLTVKLEIRRANILHGMAGEHLSLTTVQWVVQHVTIQPDAAALATLLCNGQPDAVEWLMETYPECHTAAVIHFVLQHGRMDLVVQLARGLQGSRDLITVPASALRSWWDSPTPAESQWLDMHCRVVDTQQGMQKAVKKGDLGFSKYLLQQFPTDITITSAMFIAACKSGNLALVQWLHAQLDPTELRPDALNSAVAVGHTHIVQWLQGHTTLQGNAVAMDGALQETRLDLLCYRIPGKRGILVKIKGSRR